MLNVLLVVHLIACIAVVVLVLLQRSEGGALGMSGGGAGSGLISGRGAANVLVRATMILAAVFFVTSLTMTALNTRAARAPTDVQRELQGNQGGVFDPLTAPSGNAPATTVPAPAEPAPAPAIDPLAPAVTPPPAATTPAPAPSPAPVSPPAATTPPATTPAPATTQTPAPATPAPAPGQAPATTTDTAAPTPAPAQP
jgi:preprotein translocase subunit SecG